MQKVTANCRNCGLVTKVYRVEDSFFDVSRYYCEKCLKKINILYNLVRSENGEIDT